MKKQHLAAIVLAMFASVWLAAADDTTTAPATNAPPAATNAPPAPIIPADTGPVPTNGLVLNFHDVPLTAVLNYLSAKAGLIIVSDVSLQGRVSVVAAQPVTTNDIVDLLTDQLGKNNYSVLLQGRTLTIMDAERAKTYHSTPVDVATNGYTGIPMNDEIVTEILPLHTLVAAQLIKDLDTLIPRSATVTANEAGNSIIMTAPQKDVRRIDEIINKLDGSAISEVNVFPLKFADAKAVADELKEVFQSADSDITRAQTRNSFRGGRGGGGGGGFGGFAAMMGGGGFPGGGGGGGNSSSGQNNVATKAVFVSDEQMNAVIASAPPDYMVQVTNVIAALDQPSQDVTMMKVFKLKHADPGEISDELNTLFNPTSSSSSADQSSGRTMGMRFMPPWMQQNSGGNNNQSQRMKRQTMVTVAPDRRTQAVIVTASKDMMEQIEGVIQGLDEGNQGVQMVTAIDFGGADPATVEETLAGLFSSSTAKAPTTTQTQTPLANRYTGTANSMSTAAQNLNTSTGTTGVGGK